jgi:hypothetical protein
LPPELLALVLARLDLSERLGTMARVCSLWHTAAVLATNSISIHGRHPDRDGVGLYQLAALSSWLHAHAAAAALDTLAVTGVDYASRLITRFWEKDTPINPPTFQLPVQQLASLRSLDLERITVARATHSAMRLVSWATAPVTAPATPHPDWWRLSGAGSWCGSQQQNTTQVKRNSPWGSVRVSADREGASNRACACGWDGWV